MKKSNKTINTNNPIVKISLTSKDGTVINHSEGLVMSLTLDKKHMQMSLVGIPQEHSLSWLEALKISITDMERQIRESEIK